MLSPHQLPYISKLMDDSRVEEVIVVAPEAIGEQRQNMGWEIENYEGIERCRIMVRPKDEDIDDLFKKATTDSWYLFSGIHADPNVFRWLKKSMEFSLRRGMITEGPNTYDFKHNIPNAKPLWMHRLRFCLQDKRYARKMEVVFAMGAKAAKYFESVNSNWNVFPFSYCTQSAVLKPEHHDKPVYIFIGSMEPRKDPLLILDAYSKMVNKDDVQQIRFIGSGTLLQSAQSIIANRQLEKEAVCLGVKPQKDIPANLSMADILILPSKYDGWGAVVNEALQAGCYVIVSDACGASDLIRKDSRLGCVFPQGDANKLAKAMEHCASHYTEIHSNRQFRIAWAEQNISGKALAKYLVDCLARLS